MQGDQSSTDAGANRSLEAALFDLDGLLIDSEPLWRAAEIEVFADVGVALTTADCRRTTGLRTDQVAEYWLARRPWNTERASTDRVASRINRRVIELIRARGAAKAGVDHAFEFMRSRGLRLALASSSTMLVIEAAVDRLGIGPMLEVLHSADFEAHSKPAPDVYLGAAARMGIPPQRCVALEDSIPGVRAAKAAGMRSVQVPEMGVVAGSPGVPEADVVLASLADLDEATWVTLRKAAS